MRYILTVMSFFVLSLSMAQNKSNTKPVNSSIKKNLYQQDTVIKKLNDTISLNDSAINNTNLKIVIVKEESKEDYLKYLLPIFTLLLGIGVNKLLDHLSERKKIRKSGERWNAEIRCLENPIKNQIKSLKSFLEEHEKENSEIPDLEIQTILSCEIVKSLDKAELIKFIMMFRKKKYEQAILDSNSIHGFISILTSNYDMLQKKFEEYSNNRSRYTALLSENLNLFSKAFANYQVALENELHKDVSNEPNYKPILDLFNTQIFPHLHDGDFDIYILEKDLFIPLTQIMGTLRLDPKINEMSNAVSNCLANIKAIKMEKGYLNQNLSILISRYENQLQEMNEISKSFV